MKAKVDKLDILKFVDVLTSVNYLKTNADDLDVSIIKDLKKLRDVVGKEVDKNTEFNTLNTKVNNPEKENSCCN